MNLTSLCEPLFLYICRLNRSARKAANADYRQARAGIEALFNDMQSAADKDPALTSQFDKIKLPLVFFVDSIIADSELPFAAEWHSNRLAYELDKLGWASQAEMAGDEKFFDILDETLADSSEAATDRLAVLYECIGLGFAGWYAGQYEHLRRKMMESSVRLRKRMDTDDTSRICPEAYENVDKRDFVAPPGTKVIGVGLILLVFIGILFGVNYALYTGTTGQIRNALTDIIASPTLNGRAGE